QTPGGPDPNNPVPAAENSYLTIKKHLKDALDRVEARADAKEKVLLSMVTELPAAKITTPETERITWRFRQLWDLTHLIQERNLRANTIAVSLIQKSERAFTYRQEAICPLDEDAKDLAKALNEQGAPDLALFVRRLLDHKVQLPKANAGPGPGPGGFPMPGGGFPGFPMPGGGGRDVGRGGAPGGIPNMPRPGSKIPMGGGDEPIEDKEDATASRIRLHQNERTVDFSLDLVLDSGAYGRLYNALTIFAYGVKGETELVRNGDRRHVLAKAGALLGQKGMSDRNVPPGTYPPGAFPRASSLRIARDPQ